MLNKSTKGLYLGGGWLIMGVLLIIAGLVLISTSLFATLATVLIFGSLLMLAGIIQLISAYINKHGAICA